MLVQNPPHVVVNDVVGYLRAVLARRGLELAYVTFAQVTGEAVIAGALAGASNASEQLSEMVEARQRAGATVARAVLRLADAPVGELCATLHADRSHPVEAAERAMIQLMLDEAVTQLAQAEHVRTARAPRSRSNSDELAHGTHPPAPGVANPSVTQAVGDRDAPPWTAPVRGSSPAITSSEPSAAQRSRMGALVGGSAQMRQLYATLDRVSSSDNTVLILGENGTGKELVANEIHARSNRAAKAFVATNCSALNDNLLDTELFGHKRGAFTGAVIDKPGLFEAADGGTFFLDEIGDMSPALQVKVLRVLQEGTFNRVGDTETRRVDVRIIAATNRDLAAMVEAGTFRADLFYRINVLNVDLPPLRARHDDIPMLVEAFVEKHNRQGGATRRVSAECLARLMAYPWPGNVRELENEVERLVVLAGATPILAADLLSPRIRDYDPTAVSRGIPIEPKTLPEAVERLERKMIGEALAAFRGNKTRVAQELGVSRRNLIRLVQKYELDDVRGPVLRAPQSM